MAKLTEKELFEAWKAYTLEYVKDEDNGYYVETLLMPSVTLMFEGGASFNDVLSWYYTFDHAQEEEDGDGVRG